MSLGEEYGGGPTYATNLDGCMEVLKLDLGMLETSHIGLRQKERVVSVFGKNGSAGNIDNRIGNERKKSTSGPLSPR